MATMATFQAPGQIQLRPDQGWDGWETNLPEIMHAWHFGSRGSVAWGPWGSIDVI